MNGKKITLNFRMIKRDILHHWPIWTIACVIYLFSVCLVNSLMRFSIDDSDRSIRIVQDILDSLLGSTAFLSFTIGLFAAISAFSFLGKKRKDYFFESLPFNRISLFVNRYIFGLITCLIPCFMVFIIEFFQIIVSCGAYGIPYLLEWFVLALSEYLFWYSLAVLFMTLCGRVVMAGFCYIGFSFVGMLFEFLVEIFNMICFIGVDYGTGFSGSAFGILSPIQYTFLIGVEYDYRNDILYGLFESGAFERVIFLLLAGLFFVFLSYILFYRRKSERTGDNFVYSKMKLVFSSVLSTAVSVTVTLILIFIIVYHDNAIAHRAFDRITILFILGTVGFIVFICTVMIAEKKFKVFNRPTIIKSLAFSMVLVLLGIGYMHDLFNIEGYVPKVSEINYVQIDNYEKILPNNSNYLTMSDERMKEKITELHRLILSHMDELVISDSGSHDYYSRSAKGVDYYTFTVNYRLKNNNNRVSRNYMIYEGGELDAAIKDFVKSNEGYFENAKNIR